MRACAFSFGRFLFFLRTLLTAKHRTKGGKNVFGLGFVAGGAGGMRHTFLPTWLMHLRWRGGGGAWRILALCRTHTPEQLKTSTF